MKQVKNITLGNTLFTLEEDAFVVLETYLKEVKNHFSDSEDTSEILSDIELSAAEKFSDRLSGRSAVNKEMVEEAIREIGSPEDFDADIATSVAGENDDTQGNDAHESEAGSNRTSSKKVSHRRLYRNVDDKVIGGVASGLGEYFAVDPVMMRLLFVVFGCFTGFGFLVYILMWMIVTPARTEQQKYAMRGSNATLKDVFAKIKMKKAQAQDPESPWWSIREMLAKVFAVFGKVALFIIAMFRIFFGVVLSIGGIVLGGVALLASIAFMTSGELVVDGSETLTALSNIASSGSVSIIGILALVTTILVVAAIMFLVGLSLLRKKFLLSSLHLIALISIAVLSAIIFVYSLGVKLMESRAYLINSGVLTESIEDGVYSFTIEDELVGELKSELQEDGIEFTPDGSIVDIQEFEDLEANLKGLNIDVDMDHDIEFDGDLDDISVKIQGNRLEFRGEFE